MVGLANAGPALTPSANTVAILQARRGAPGYSWLRIYFYSFPLDAKDVAGVRNVDVGSMEKKWQAGGPVEDNSKACWGIESPYRPFFPSRRFSDMSMESTDPEDMSKDDSYFDK